MRAYTDTLNDPFEHAGVNLGYDCYLPTSLVAAYNRNSLTVNADGSFCLVLFPSATGMVQESNNPKGLAHSSAFLDASNRNNIVANFTEGRIVSGGIRCFALFPETAAPGVLFSGSCPDFAVSNYQAGSTDGFAALPGSQLGIGNRGATATLRPYDNGSFEFYAANLSGHSVNAVPFMTSAYVAGTGFPVGTVIWYEAVLNIEAIAGSIQGSSAVPSDFDMGPTTASWFPTPGALFTAAQRYLSPTIVMDGVAATLNLARGNYGAAAASGARLAHRLGSGSNWNRFVQHAGAQSTVVIEEMKEEADPRQSSMMPASSARGWGLR